MQETPMSFKPEAALAINHVGLTVPDIHAAIDWYGEVFGFGRKFRWYRAIPVHHNLP
jgi:catechol 2,3-dioxygenase-like lactoylglutathione lyase family enzyme